MKRGPKAIPFEDHVVRSEGCWEWSGSLFNSGYGRTIEHRASRLAHRVAWEREYGAIPAGLYVCHHCDNKRCVRPDHLFLGSPADNLADMVRKGRSLRGQRNHHAKLTDEAVRLIRQDYAAGGWSHLRLAQRHGVSENAIFVVIHRQGWSHVQEVV